MPEFTLDTAGVVSVDTRVSEGRAPGTSHPVVITAWRDLDAFTQGYVEAMFFTCQESLGVDRLENHGDDRTSGFSDLAPETLARIIADCAAFQKKNVVALACCQMTEEERDELAEYGHGPGWDSESETATALGRDFWYTRNGFWGGFWDSDWPEPHGEALTDAAKAFPERDPYVGDDGKVYL
jgi:hypothetical protein